MASRSFEMLFTMINAGELTVGEAREELASPFLPRDATELLAGWVMDRADQGDQWKAGDPVVLTCGCRTSYDMLQADTQCDGTACELPRAILLEV